MNDNFFRQEITLSIMDCRDDTHSHAEAFVGLGIGGFYLTNVRPPQSIVAHQKILQGYRMENIFNKGIDVKKYDGVSKPKPDGQYIITGQLALRLRSELLKSPHKKFGLRHRTIILRSIILSY